MAHEGTFRVTQMLARSLAPGLGPDRRGSTRTGDLRERPSSLIDFLLHPLPLHQRRGLGVPSPNTLKWNNENVDIHVGSTGLPCFDDDAHVPGRFYEGRERRTPSYLGEND